MLEKFENFEKIEENLKKIQNEENYGDGYEKEYEVVLIEGEKSEIQKNIYKDKSDFKNITSKYLALKKQLDEYKNIDLEINKEKMVINNFESEIKKNNYLIFEKRRKIEKILEGVKNMNFDIENLLKKIKNLKNMINKLNIEIEELKNKINFFSEEILKKLKIKFEKENKNFKIRNFEIEKEEKNLLEKKNNLNNKIKDFNKSLIVLQNNYLSLLKVIDNEKKICNSYFIFFKQTIKVIPVLENDYSNDQKNFKKLKNTVINELQFAKDI